MTCGLADVPPAQLPAAVGFAAAAIEPPTPSASTATTATNETFLMLSPFLSRLKCAAQPVQTGAWTPVLILSQMRAARKRLTRLDKRRRIIGSLEGGQDGLESQRQLRRDVLV